MYDWHSTNLFKKQLNVVLVYLKSAFFLSYVATKMSCLNAHCNQYSVKKLTQFEKNNVLFCIVSIHSKTSQFLAAWNDVH